MVGYGSVSNFVIPANDEIHKPAIGFPMQAVVYIITNHRHGTLYTGVTSNLAKRMYEHREELNPGFSKRYGLKMLVWYEVHATMPLAITKEKQIKAWRRSWKIEEIEKMNPTWRDMYGDLAY